MPAAACATPALSGLVSRSAGKTVLLMSGTSKIKNENPDDFATYLAKRQAAAEGREWVPEGGAPAAAAPSYGAPAAAAPAYGGPPPQDAGEVPYDAAWGGTPKAHTKESPAPMAPLLPRELFSADTGVGSLVWALGVPPQAAS